MMAEEMITVTRAELEQLFADAYAVGYDAGRNEEAHSRQRMTDKARSGNTIVGEVIMKSHIRKSGGTRS